MIPLAKDVASLVGEWAERIENRSLLHDKFALPKVWGQPPGGKLNDAGRWNILRIVTRGSELLKGDAQRLRREAGGQNVRPDIAERKENEACVAEAMAAVARPDSVLASMANAKATLFLQALTQSYGRRVTTFEATLGGRLMINLAGGVIENAGMSLDRSFGLPFVPGSAIKGITRAQALWDIRSAPETEKRRLLLLALLIFGYGKHDLTGDFAQAVSKTTALSLGKEIDAEEFKGCICFLPAYPTTTPTLVVDMVNPHYPDYYGGRAPSAEDTEKPIPNYFPAVEAGSTFGFAVLLNRVPAVTSVSADDLLQQARLWLERAITRKGVGAKTAAGYGWFELRRTATRPPSALNPPGAVPAPSLPAEHPLILKWRGRLATKDNFPVALPEMAALADLEELRRVFEVVIPENERRRLRKTERYWQAFTSGRAGDTGKKILERLGLTLR